MKCRKLYPEKRMCGQSECIEIAKCLTRISGFDVLACKKHHACDGVESSEIPRQSGSVLNASRHHADKPTKASGKD